MFLEPMITWVPLGFSGYVWLDTKIVLKNKLLLKRLLDSNVSSLIWAGWRQERHPITVNCSNILCNGCETFFKVFIFYLAEIPPTYSDALNLPDLYNNPVCTGNLSNRLLLNRPEILGVYSEFGYCVQLISFCEFASKSIKGSSIYYIRKNSHTPHLCIRTHESPPITVFMP